MLSRAGHILTCDEDFAGRLSPGGEYIASAAKLL